MTSRKDIVKSIWRTADCVCFDVDSTVCIDEGIDELALYLNVGEKVANLTKSAMQGGMTYRKSLEQRLNIMKPSKQDIEQFNTEHPPKLTEGVKELVDELQSNNIPVYLISGGFHCIIERVAEKLNISKNNIRANKLLFYYDGSFAGFDEKRPTCDSGGKPIVISDLKSEFGFKKVVHIGDGVTDMEAAPPADAFIGFGGNQVRPKVKENADWFVMTFQELHDELNTKKIKTSE